MFWRSTGTIEQAIVQTNAAKFSGTYKRHPALTS